MKEVSVIKLLLEEAWVEVIFMIGFLFVDLFMLFYILVDLISIKTNLL